MDYRRENGIHKENSLSTTIKSRKAQNDAVPQRESLEVFYSSRFFIEAGLSKNQVPRSVV
jgi:hypothetical protein